MDQQWKELIKDNIKNEDPALCAALDYFIAATANGDGRAISFFTPDKLARLQSLREAVNGDDQLRDRVKLLRSNLGTREKEEAPAPELPNFDKAVQNSMTSFYRMMAAVVVSVVCVVIGATLTGVAGTEYSIAKNPNALYSTQCTILKSTIESYSAKQGIFYRALFSVNYTDANGVVQTNMAGVAGIDSVSFDLDESDPTQEISAFPVGMTVQCMGSTVGRMYQSVLDDVLHDVSIESFTILNFSQAEWEAFQTK
eukprot:TRINITY_DN5790_c2_g1_i1.p1 TRINITY_DN5790_c2_g1~~TRINITY_DN5790_c2_g1_i1.p1  ORF type:complete len:284 (-),score=40.91 TRINITY_DN5790_c2_g1_i1:443-1207(-)